MKKLKDLDLEKLIIIISLVLMPVAGGWIYWLKERMKDGQQSLTAATRPGGLIEDIATLEKQIRQIKEGSETQGKVDDYNHYFEVAVMTSQKEGTALIQRQDFTIKALGNPKAVRKPRSRKVIATEIEVEVAFRRTRRQAKALPRSLVNAIAYNAEWKSPVWKLRKLQIKNTDIKKGGVGGKGVPDLEIGDNWTVDSMVFARRKPPDSDK